MKKITLIAAAILLQLSVFAQLPSYVSSNGIIGWWPFDGNTLDQSTNGVDGTNNGAVLSTDRFGNPNSAYSFDGSSFIDFGNDSIINPYDAMTISFWIQTDAVLDSAGIIGIWENISFGGNENSFAFQIDGENVAGSIKTGGGANIGLPGTFNDDQWHHLALTFSNDEFSPGIFGQYFFYVNGKVVSGGASSSPNGISQNNASFEAGRFKQGLQASDYFQGNIDDIGYWSRVLSRCEIRDLYESQLDFVSNSITVTSPSIEADFNAPGVEYQWMNCMFGNDINGDTNQLFTAPGPGEYAVIIDYFGCIDTSSCTVIEFTGISEIENTFEVYPNPNNGQFTIKNLSPSATIQLFDALGRVQELHSLGLDKFEVIAVENGTYYLQINDNKHSQTIPLTVIL